MAVGKLASEVLIVAADLASFGIDPRIALHADLDNIDFSFVNAVRMKLLKDREIRDENFAIMVGHYVARALGGE